MDPNSYGGMGQGMSAYGGSAMGGPPGNFGGQSFGPPSNYIPSGLGAPSPYMATGYTQMPGNGQSGFDSRAEQAFNQGNASASGGAPGYSNGGYGSGNGSSSYGNDGSADPFSFLNAGMGNLGLTESNERRNGQGQSSAKSPQ